MDNNIINVNTKTLYALFNLGIDTYHKFLNLFKREVLRDYISNTNEVNPSYECIFNELKNNSNFIGDMRFIYGDINRNNLSDDDVKNKLCKLLDLGIYDIQYSDEYKFDEKFSRKLEYGTDGNNKYINRINWVYTDGDIIHEFPINKDGYTFYINNSNYVLEFSKDVSYKHCNSDYNSYNFRLKSFGFNINSLEDNLSDYRLIKKTRKDIIDKYKIDNILRELIKLKSSIDRAEIDISADDRLVYIYSILNNIDGIKNERDYLFKLIYSDNRYHNELESIINKTVGKKLVLNKENS